MRKHEKNRYAGSGVDSVQFSVINCIALRCVVHLPETVSASNS